MGAGGCCCCWVELLPAALLPVYAARRLLFERFVACRAAPPAPLRPALVQSFKFVVDTWGCSLTTREQVDLIEALEVPTQFRVRAAPAARAALRLELRCIALYAVCEAVMCVVIRVGERAYG